MTRSTAAGLLIEKERPTARIQTKERRLNLDGSERRKSGTKLDLGTYAALFYGREVGTGRPWNLGEIGQWMGVSREYVRQVRKRYFPHLGSTRIETKPFYKQKGAAKQLAKRPTLFRYIVRGWLKAQGYIHCCHCRRVVCVEAAAKRHGKGERCRGCSAASVYKRRKVEENPRAIACADCGRILLLGRNQQNPHFHKSPTGEACDGWKKPALPVPQKLLAQA